MRFAFMAGLPRSGSTLLCSLLNQRNDVYVSTLTDSPEIMKYFDLEVPKFENYQAGSTSQREQLLKNVLYAMYSDKDVELVIDKSRLWGTPYNINLLKRVLQEYPKIICPVRPLKDIVASFINMAKNNENNYIDIEMFSQDFPPRWMKNIDDARADFILQPYGPLSYSMLSLSGAFKNETKDLYHLVSYDELCYNTVSSLRKIEKFLLLSKFDYDFTNIKQHPYNDTYYGVPDMHKVKETIVHSEINANKILSEYAIARCNIEDFWTEKIQSETNL